jgi:hypothetical protein
MNRPFTIDPITDVRVLADKAEQMAQEIRRTVAAIEEIVDDLKGIYEVASPIVKWLRSTLAPPVKTQVLVSTEE